MLAARTSRLAVALAAVLALAACGQTSRLQPTSKATASPIPGVDPTVIPTPSPTPSDSSSESGGPTPSGSSSSQTGGGNAVKTDSTANKFVPATLTVKVGTKVTFTADQPYHSANSGTPPTVDKSGPIQAPIGFSTYAVTFTKPGTYKYFCQPHASLGMVGEIVVK